MDMFIDIPDTKTINAMKYIMKFHDLDQRPVCQICGTIITAINTKSRFDKPSQYLTDKYAFRKYCGCKCAQLGPEAIENRKKTCMAKYGTDSIFASDHFKSKSKDTLIERYGVDNCSKNPVIRARQVKTWLETIGDVDKSKIRKEKMIANNNLKFGADHHMKSPEFMKTFLNGNKKTLAQIDVIIGKLIDEAENFFSTNSKKISRMELANTLDVPYSTVNYWLRIYDLGDIVSDSPTSSYEGELVSFVESLGVNVIQHDRTILKGKELDIFCPDERFAIEFNGVYWHCEAAGKDRTYHVNKTSVCESAGLKLMHIWDHEWINRRPIVESMIRSKLNKISNKIDARKCDIIDLTPAESRKFFDDNHIQGARVAKHKLGLVYEGELVFAMTFSTPRFNSNYDFEIIRMATRLNTVVRGGFGRLFTEFTRRFPGKSVISYSEIRLGVNGSAYSSRMKLLKSTSPGWFCVKGGAVINRMALTKHKLKLLPGFDETKSADDNIFAMGYRKTWDCGQLVFIFEPFKTV